MLRTQNIPSRVCGVFFPLPWGLRPMSACTRVRASALLVRWTRLGEAAGSASSGRRAAWLC